MLIYSKFWFIKFKQMIKHCQLSFLLLVGRDLEKDNLKFLYLIYLIKDKRFFSISTLIIIFAINYFNIIKDLTWKGLNNLTCSSFGMLSRRPTNRLKISSKELRSFMIGSIYLLIMSTFKPLNMPMRSLMHLLPKKEFNK